MTKMPIEELVQNMVKVTASIEKIVNSPETTRTIESVGQGVDDVRRLVKTVQSQMAPVVADVDSVARDFNRITARVDSSIAPLAESITKTSDNASTALVQAQALIGKLDGLTDNASAVLGQTHELIGQINGLTDNDSVVVYRLTRAMEEFEAAARSIRVLGDSLERQPTALIWGKKSMKGESK